MNIVLEILVIAFQAIGFIFLLPNFEEEKMKRTGIGEITKTSDKIIAWIANHGRKYGIYLILIGFAIQIVSLFC